MSRQLCRTAGVAIALLLVAGGGIASGQGRATEGPSVQASPSPAAAKKAAEPFAFADFSWVPGHYAAAERPLSVQAGSSEVLRHGEFQLTQLGLGRDFSYKDVQARA